MVLKKKSEEEIPCLGKANRKYALLNRSSSILLQEDDISLLLNEKMQTTSKEREAIFRKSEISSFLCRVTLSLQGEVLVTL